MSKLTKTAAVMQILEGARGKEKGVPLARIITRSRASRSFVSNLLRMNTGVCNVQEINGVKSVIVAPDAILGKGAGFNKRNDGGVCCFRAADSRLPRTPRPRKGFGAMMRQSGGDH